MNKKILISGIAILLVCVSLSGCFENRDNRFVGTWAHRDYGSIFEYFSDGKGTIQGTPMTWEIKDGKLVMKWLDGESALTYNYEFSENNTKLTLTNVNDGSVNYMTKIK